ncbi:MAG: Flp pilus assembly complex ATPase component TadA [Candidatus Aminicenantes bacterium]|nr:Flp pilus assembly complex ATPase component TadA [Candidatus Aminicenantes bacterium]
MSILEAFVLPGIIAVSLLAFLILMARWLDAREARRKLIPAPSPPWRAAPAEEFLNLNPNGPLTTRQARKLLEDVLQAAIRQKAEAILIDALAGRPQVRLRGEGGYEELTGIGDKESFRRLVAEARSCAGLDPQPAAATTERGSFLRLYRKPHLRNAEWMREDGESSFSFIERRRKNRAVRFDLEAYPAPGGEALKISLRPEMEAEDTRFDLGFAREAEGRFIRAARSRSGIVLLTGPCNSGKSTATYNVLALLRDEGRRIVTVEWPAEWTLTGVTQHNLGDGSGACERVGPSLRQAIGQKPDVLLLQNIDWVNDEDARAAIDFAAGGGLLVTAVHSPGCVWGLSNLFRRHFRGRRRDLAELLRIVVSPRQLFMFCGHCAEEHRVPKKILVEAGLPEAPAGPDDRVATWRGRGCPLCENTGELGSLAVYEVLDFTGEMRNFLDNANDWNFGQLEYLERQAWQRGMRTQRELALERVVAGDIRLQNALLNTVNPRWLVKAQAARKKVDE